MLYLHAICEVCGSHRMLTGTIPRTAKNHLDFFINMANLPEICCGEKGFPLLGRGGL